MSFATNRWDMGARYYMIVWLDFVKQHIKSFCLTQGILKQQKKLWQIKTLILLIRYKILKLSITMLQPIYKTI